MWANNETGVIATMHEIVALAHSAGALVHTDAVQATGKIHLDVQTTPVDFLSLSGHKMHAPKGIGALFVRRTAPFLPLIVGGGQEQERRSGTENVPGIVALGTAAARATVRLPDLLSLRDALEQRLLAALPDAVIHSREAPRLPNTTSICVPGVDAAALIIRLDQKGIACSGGSACHTASLHPSHVLAAMGVDADRAGSTLRLSVSSHNTAEEMQEAADQILAAVEHLRAQWDRSSLVTVG